MSGARGKGGGWLSEGRSRGQVGGREQGAESGNERTSWELVVVAAREGRDEVSAGAVGERVAEREGGGRGREGPRRGKGSVVLE